MASEDFLQFLRWYNFQLRVRTFVGILFCSPAAKVSHMSKAIALHVLVSYLDYKLGTQRLPGKIFSAAPAAFATGHAMFVTVCIVISLP
jgi:hypothetical protein